MDLPDFNQSYRSSQKSGELGDRWYDEAGDEPLESPPRRPSRFMKFVKEKKWILLLDVLVLIAVIVTVVVLTGKNKDSGNDDREPPATVSSDGGTTTSPVDTPTTSPVDTEGTGVPTTVAMDDQQPAATLPYSPVLSPAQAPIASPAGDGLVLNQFGEVAGFDADSGVTSLASAVSGDGGTVALLNRPAAGSNLVEVSVYRFDKAGNWQKLGEDISDNVDPNMRGAGQSLALSLDGNTLAIGFFAATCNEAGENCGRLRVFSLQDGAWTQLGEDVVGKEPNVHLGWSVAISHDGQTVAAGVPYSNSADGKFHVGKVKVLRLDADDTWKSVGTDIEGDLNRDMFGSSVALSADGSIVACGTPQAESLGFVRVLKYDESTGDFIQLGSDILGDERTHQFGFSVSLSNKGLILAIGGTTGEADNDVVVPFSGLASVYKLEDIGWIKLGEDIETGTPGDLFGWSVELDADGNRVVVGAPQSDGLAGKAFLFEFRERGWIQRGEDIEPLYYEGEIGRSVSLSSSGFVVAAGGRFGVQIYYDSRIPDYTSNVNGLSQLGEVVSGGADGGLSIASALSRDGTTTAVARRVGGSEVERRTRASARRIQAAAEIVVSVYRYDASGEWVKLGDDLTGTGDVDAVGKSLALSQDGNTLVAGFFSEGCEAGDNCGHVRVYSFENLAWNQLGQDIIGSKSQGFLGWSVSISDDGLTVAAGAPMSDGDNGVDRPGKVRLFQFENDWIQLGPDLEGDNEWDHLGSSLSLSGDGTYLASGAVQSLDGNLGYVKVYQYDESTAAFAQVGENIIGDERTDKFGGAVSLSDNGSMLAVGSTIGGINEDDDEVAPEPSFGIVSVFQNESNGWAKLGSDIESGETGDLFGYSVAISGDGTAVVVGAPEHYSNSGSVLVYFLDQEQTSWVQVIDEIYPVEKKNSEESQLGRSVAISFSGQVIAAGGRNGVQVYQIDLPEQKESAPSSPFFSPAFTPSMTFPFAPSSPFFSPGFSPSVSSPSYPFASPGSSPSVGSPSYPFASPGLSPSSNAAPVSPGGGNSAPFVSPVGIGGPTTASEKDNIPTAPLAPSSPLGAPFASPAAPFAPSSPLGAPGVSPAVAPITKDETPVAPTVTPSLEGSETTTVPTGTEPEMTPEPTTQAAQQTNEAEKTPIPSAQTTVQDAPTQMVTPEPSPLATEEVTPLPTTRTSIAETPAPVAAETPAPIATETPAPIATETPAPIATETPAPIAAETPAPIAAETPSPITDTDTVQETPAPINQETPAPVEQNAPETPAPVEQMTPETPAPVDEASPEAPTSEGGVPSAPARPSAVELAPVFTPAFTPSMFTPSMLTPAMFFPVTPAWSPAQWPVQGGARRVLEEPTFDLGEFPSIAGEDTADDSPMETPVGEPPSSPLEPPSTPTQDAPSGPVEPASTPTEDAPSSEAAAPSTPTQDAPNSPAEEPSMLMPAEAPIASEDDGRRDQKRELFVDLWIKEFHSGETQADDESPTAAPVARTNVKDDPVQAPSTPTEDAPSSPLEAPSTPTEDAPSSPAEPPSTPTDDAPNSPVEAPSTPTDDAPSSPVEAPSMSTPAESPLASEDDGRRVQQRELFIDLWLKEFHNGETKADDESPTPTPVANDLDDAPVQPPADDSPSAPSTPTDDSPSAPSVPTDDSPSAPDSPAAVTPAETPIDSPASSPIEDDDERRRRALREPTIHFSKRNFPSVETADESSPVEAPSSPAVSFEDFMTPSEMMEAVGELLSPAESSSEESPESSPAESPESSPAESPIEESPAESPIEESPAESPIEDDSPAASPIEDDDERRRRLFREPTIHFSKRNFPSVETADESSPVEAPSSPAVSFEDYMTPSEMMDALEEVLAPAESSSEESPDSSPAESPIEDSPAESPIEASPAESPTEASPVESPIEDDYRQRVLREPTFYREALEEADER